MHEDPTRSFASRTTACPTCGAPAERGQLVCLECGSRVALSYRRPPSWKVPVAITAALLVLVAVAGVLAYRAIDDEAEREAAATPARVKASGDSGSGGERAGAKEEAGADRPAGEEEPNLGEDENEAEATPEDEGEPPPESDAPAATTDDGLVKAGSLYTWPRSLRAFTVVLLSNEDRASATAFARSAAKSDGEPIGVISSADFGSLPKGFFVVFAGRYPDRAAADRAAARLGRRFPGAFPQLVRR